MATSQVGLSVKVHRLRGAGAVWAMVVAITLYCAWLTYLIGNHPAPAKQSIPILVLAPLFFLGEVAVVHLRLRSDAHSYSLSEIPRVIGIYFAPTIGQLVFAQLLGNAFAFIAVRRQTPMRASFNLAQNTLQTLLTVAVFQLLAGEDPFGPRGWLGALVGSGAALLAATVLIMVAINLTGGRIDPVETKRVLGFSTLAMIANTTFGVIGVQLAASRPEALPLVVVPGVLAFLAYRRLIFDQERLDSLDGLYDLTRDLHASQRIEDAVAYTLHHARRLLQGTFAVAVVHDSETDRGWLSFDTEDRRETMVPHPHARSDWTAGLFAPEDAASIIPQGAPVASKDLALVSLTSGERPAGYIAVGDRLGQVSTFGSTDVALLDSIAKQLSVSLTKGNLQLNLARVDELNQSLQQLLTWKDQFLASVSHELRTPLTGIVGLASELAENGQLFSSDEMKEMHAVIADEGRDLAAIIDDLLVAARADIGALTLLPEEISIVGEIESLISTTRLEKGQKPEMVSTPLEVMCKADRVRTRQIIRNLLTNAGRYGGPKVWVKAAQYGAAMRVEVCDDGGGVPMAATDAIFEAYGRAEPGRRNPESVGLGLSVARRLAEAMGGSLEYHRRADHTAFVLQLPVP